LQNDCAKSCINVTTNNFATLKTLGAVLKMQSIVNFIYIKNQ